MKFWVILLFLKHGAISFQSLWNFLQFFFENFFDNNVNFKTHTFPRVLPPPYLATGYRLKKTPSLMPRASSEVAARLTPRVTPVSSGVSRRNKGNRMRAWESEFRPKLVLSSSTAMLTDVGDLDREWAKYK